MAKKDAIIGVIIGFLIGFFLFIVLEFLQVEIFPNWLLIIIFPPLTFFGLLTASLIGKKFLAVWQLANFILVGALNTFVDFGVLNFLMWVFGLYIGFSFAIFKGVSFLTATVNSYFWNKHWTFKSGNGTFVRGEYLKFLVIATVGFLINVGVSSFIVNVIGPQSGIKEKLWANFGAFLAVFVTFAWNFLGSKFIVFKK